MQLIWFILACYGLTQILVYGSIFNKIRPTKGTVGVLFRCPMCLGFWVGIIVCLISPFTELFMFEVNLANLLLCGWLSSGTSYILCKVFDDDGIKIKGANK